MLRDINALVRAYLAVSDLCIQFSSIVWTPDTVKDIVLLEGVQRPSLRSSPVSTVTVTKIDCAVSSYRI